MVVDMQADNSNFVSRFPNLRYHGNRGLGESLTDTIQLADPKNPLVGASIWGVSPAQAKL